MLQSVKVTAKIILFKTKADFVHSELYFQFHSDRSTSYCDYTAQKEMGKDLVHCTAHELLISC